MFYFKKNNKQTKKPVNCFLQDDASAGIQSLQTSIEIKLCQNHGTDHSDVLHLRFTTVVKFIAEKFNFKEVSRGRHSKIWKPKNQLFCD